MPRNDSRERMVDMRRAGNSTIDLGVSGISVVISVPERGAGTREGSDSPHGCPRSAAGVRRSPRVPQLEDLENIGRR